MAKQITARQAFAAGVTASHYDMTKVRHTCGHWHTYRRYITLNVVAEMEKCNCPKCSK